MVLQTIVKPDGTKIRQTVDEQGNVTATQEITKEGEYKPWKIIDKRTGKPAGSPDKPPKGYGKGYASFEHAVAGSGKKVKYQYDDKGKLKERIVIDKQTGRILWKDVAGGATGAVMTNVIGKSRRIGGITAKDIKSVMATGKESAFYEEYEQGKPKYKVEQKVIKRLATKRLQNKRGEFVEVTPVEKEIKFTIFRNGREIPVETRRMADKEIGGRGSREYIISGLMKLLGKPRKEVEKMVRITKERAKKQPRNPTGEITPADVIATAQSIAMAKEQPGVQITPTKEGVYKGLTKAQKVAMHLSTLLSPKFMEYVKSLAPGGITPEEVVIKGMQLGRPPTEKEIIEMARQKKKAYEIYQKHKLPAHLATIFSPQAFDYIVSGAVPGGRTTRDVAIENIRRYSVEPARTGRKQKFMPYLIRSPAFQIPALYAGGAIIGSVGSPVVGAMVKSQKVAKVASSGLLRYGLPASMVAMTAPGAYLEYSFNVQSGMSKREALERVGAKFGKEAMTMLAFGMGLEKGLKAGFPVKRKKLKTPSGKTFVNALVLEYGEPRGAMKLLGKIDDVLPEELIGYEVGSSPFEAKTVRKILSRNLPEDELFKLQFHQEYGGRLKGVKSKFTDPGLIKYGTERLSSEAVEETLKIIKKEPHLIYGSQAGRAMYPERLGRRAIHDIDIMVFKNADEVLAMTQKIQKKLDDLGYITEIHEPRPGAFKIYTKQPDGSMGKALEIFSHETSYGTGVPEGGWGYKYGLKPQRLHGIKTMSPGEHFLRKGGSILRIGEKGFAPEAHRMKDIVDYILTAEGQIASMEASPLTSVIQAKMIKKMKRDLKRLQKAWGVTDEMLAQGQYIIGANLPGMTTPRPSLPLAPPTLVNRFSRPLSKEPRYKMTRASRMASDPIYGSPTEIYRRLAMAQRSYKKMAKPSPPSRASRARRRSMPSYPFMPMPSYPSAPSRQRPSYSASRPSMPSYMVESKPSYPSRPSSKRSKPPFPSAPKPSAPSFPSMPSYYYNLFSPRLPPIFARPPPMALKKRIKG